MLENIIIFLNLLSMGILIYHTYTKIIKNEIKVNKIIIYLGIIIFSIICVWIRVNSGFFISIIIWTMFISYMFSWKNNDGIGHVLILTIVCLAINYIIRFLAIIIVFFICKMFNLQIKIIKECIVFLIQAFILLYISKLKRIKNGMSYFKMNLYNSFLDFNMLNICIVVSFFYFLLIDLDMKDMGKTVTYFGFYTILLILTIKKSIEAYYKQKLLVQDLNETKRELEEKKKEVEELEKENLGFNKRSHSLAYKQKSLEFKLNKLLMKSEFADELGLTDEFKNISIQMKENEKLPKLDRTGIIEVDDMLDMMQEECRKNKIDFTLQLKGNIYQMTNNFIDKEDLATLLADHIKDAIIAINHTDNLNKSIMVRLGKIDECFAVYFYDSGVEFPEEIFNELGTGPITAYANEGGTGLGFMNTFDVLRKKNASLIVENLGKPSIDNYTKIIKIIFDNKNKIMFDKTKIL